MSMAENKLPNETLENAIGVYKTTIDACKNVDDEDYNPILDKVTVAFLEELHQYRAIGTVDELKRVVAFIGDDNYSIVDELKLLNQYREIGTVAEVKASRKKNEKIVKILRTHRFTDEMCIEKIIEVVRE